MTTTQTNRKCSNCGVPLKQKEAGHYVPPSLGEEGFFACETIAEIEAERAVPTTTTHTPTPVAECPRCQEIIQETRVRQIRTRGLKALRRLVELADERGQMRVVHAGQFIDHPALAEARAIIAEIDGK